jgi:hypothetical protein
MNLERLFQIALVLFLCSGTSSLSAKEEPSENTFVRSSHNLEFQLPTVFILATQSRSYLSEATHEVARFQRIWKHGPDVIIVNVIVVPDLAWSQKTSQQLFADGMGAMLADSTLKLVSQRNYELDSCPAKSITSFYQGGSDATSQRMDCFLSKPNMYMVAYISPKPSSWEDPVCKAFFESISLKPRT